MLLTGVLGESDGHLDGDVATLPLLLCPPPPAQDYEIECCGTEAREEEDHHNGRD